MTTVMFWILMLLLEIVFSIVMSIKNNSSGKPTLHLDTLKLWLTSSLIGSVAGIAIYLIVHSLG